MLDGPTVLPSRAGPMGSGSRQLPQGCLSGQTPSCFTGSRRRRCGPRSIEHVVACFGWPATPRIVRHRPMTPALRRPIPRPRAMSSSPSAGRSSSASGSPSRPSSGQAPRGLTRLHAFEAALAGRDRRTRHHRSHPRRPPTRRVVHAGGLAGPPDRGRTGHRGLHPPSHPRRGVRRMIETACLQCGTPAVRDRRARSAAAAASRMAIRPRRRRAARPVRSAT